MKIISTKGNDFTIEVYHNGEKLQLAYFTLGVGIIPNYNIKLIEDAWERVCIDADVRRFIKKNKWKLGISFSQDS